MYTFIATYWAGIANWGYIGKALVGNIMIWMGVCVLSVAKGRKNLALISFCIAWASVPVMIFLQANELRPQVSVASYTDIVPAMQMVILSFECLLFLIAGCIFLSALVFFLWSKAFAIPIRETCWRAFGIDVRFRFHCCYRIFSGEIA